MAETKNPSNPSEELQVPASVSRVADIPVVKSALNVATSWYGWVKGYNPVVESGLNRAEQTVLMVAGSARPVIQKLEKPINYADSLVCQGLDKLEEKVPAIKKSPEELKSAGWEKLEEVKGYGTSSVDTVKSYVTSQVDRVRSSSYAQAVAKSVDTAMELTEAAVDNYLPASADEPAEPANGPNNQEQSVLTRMSALSEKMRRRLYRYDFILMKRALDLLKPVKALTSN